MDWSRDGATGAASTPRRLEVPAGPPIPPQPAPAAPPRLPLQSDPRLSIPPLPPRLVSRPRLLDALDAAVNRAALTLVTAGPGGGKSVLLSEWARRRRPGQTAWLALSRADNDPVRFWSLFLKAVRTGPPPLFPTAWSPEAVPGLLDSLFGEERPGTPPVVVVLDDAHLLTNRDVLDGLDRVIQRWSLRVRLVLATRSVPLLPLHRYRLSDQLVELRAADLAMTPDEARALFAAHSVALSDEETRLLTARTEGWTGGLRLAALRMEGSACPARVALELAMDSGSIGEYLVEEVLSVQPEHVRRLLVETSFLDAVSGEAAEAITGIEGAGDILADLARTNSFVVPLDPSYTLFRYHQLFREVLRHLARRRTDSAAKETSRRATEWFRRTRDIANAVQWALRSGDHGLARVVLVRGGLGQAFVCGQDLGEVPTDELLTVDPEGGEDDADELAVARAAVVALRAQRSDAAESGPRQNLPTPEPADPELRVTTHLARALTARADGDYAAMNQALDRLLAEDVADAVAAVPGLRSKALLLKARGSFFVGRPAEVEPLLRRALAEAEAERAVATELEILGVQALANASAGRPRKADQALARAANTLRRHPTLGPPVTLDVAAARRAYVKADLATMAQAMHRALAAGPIHTDRGVAASIAFLQALLLSASGKTAEARHWLYAPVLNGPELGLLAVYRDCELAQIEVALGRPQHALALLQPYAKGSFAVTAAVPAALARLATGDATGAERELQQLLTSPSGQVDRYVLVGALLCQAQIAVQRHDDARALDTLARARELADGDVVMPFVRATPTFAPLLARHPEMAAGWPAAVPASADDQPGHPPIDRLPEPLTEREQMVLRLLATTMSTADMSAELVVSVNTVKTHLAAIYRKLGVGQRREAVQRARELELL